MAKLQLFKAAYELEQCCNANTACCKENKGDIADLQAKTYELDQCCDANTKCCGDLTYKTDTMQGEIDSNHSVAKKTKVTLQICRLKPMSSISAAMKIKPAAQKLRAM